MHKLTLITWVTNLIKLLLKKYSIKHDQRFRLCIPTGNSYSPLNFNIFQQNFVSALQNSKFAWNLQEQFSYIIDQTLW